MMVSVYWTVYYDRSPLNYVFSFSVFKGWAFCYPYLRRGHSSGFVVDAYVISRGNSDNYICRHKRRTNMIDETDFGCFSNMKCTRRLPTHFPG